MTIVLQGEKVTLRDLTEEDIRTIYYYEYEAEDREHLLWNGPYGVQEWESYESFAPKFTETLALVYTDEPRSRLVIDIDGELKGTVGRYWLSKETNWFEIGIVLFDSRFWSGGYGTEAFRMWMEYLFDAMDTVRLGIGTWSGNIRMMGLAAKCGMIEEARVRKARIVRGEYYDAIKMGILREEWEAARSQ
ncbi:GNAT family N-acetyltransferase [Paenibacillus sp. P46E]|uniref:GNAT family N-acetyltransferase n=1 Tax=Paenibacillus sp. P46E TaxID=1349436 RepID=UPI00093BE8C0|nr:GNAT family protein [Paenibacillus sp. P46E]OKP96776.1 GNAT family acetyltransferase [Paenibacillus sp. P46E]